MNGIAIRPDGGERCFAMPINRFLRTALVCQAARRAACTPVQLLFEHLPAEAATLEPEELGDCVAEACETAANFAVDRVKLDDRDVAFVRKQFRLLAGDCPILPDAV